MPFAQNDEGVAILDYALNNRPSTGVWAVCAASAKRPLGSLAEWPFRQTAGVNPVPFAVLKD